MSKFFIVLLVAFGLSISVNAATGCVLNSNLSKIYTSLQSGTTYRSTTSSNALSGCVYKQTTNPCTVSGLGSGFLGDTTILNCPIDDYNMLILLVVAGLGFFYIRKKNLILN
ncbi:hypothetical protein [Pedobacter boryungensis]|uniref:IPTL-CTERM protein sorting domain-containing protein n=1 Tax=Pedobacter boryungensis TaxID=869962 RepID=A0ABX2DF78_9SPHI|nr:hypothetical protein [Pedobacter boryungensis]NQX32467.1 hypothetical protein [Pedobacter boryungensis]